MKFNIIKKMSFLLLALTLSTSFFSCEQQESVPDENIIVTKDIVGTWVVEVEREGAHYTYNTIALYNTSDNSDDAIWIDDLEHSWGLKVKADLNFSDLTFSGTDLDELYYGVTVNITEGQIIKDGATTPSGDTTDSISFKAEFSDLPGEEWYYYGYKSTAKVEDLP